MRILHVIERLGRGGAARSMLALARHCRRSASRQTVLSLRAPDPLAAELARSAGLEILAGDDKILWRQVAAAADIVHVHFWNTPELYAWLREPQPSARLLLTVHVAGEHPAQVATKALLQFADFVVATCPYSLDLPRFRELPADKLGMVLESPDFDRLAPIPSGPHPTFTVGYVGTVGFVKIHPRFIEMSTAALLPGARFVVCGDGDALKPLARRAAEVGMAERFEWRGYVDDIAAALAGFDVFGYPLRPDNYASGELVLQEAMYAGVPPVVLAHGAPARLIEHGHTGLIAHDEHEYAQALAMLHDQPAARQRLARNARERARASWGAARAAPQLLAIYERAMALPKRARRWCPQRLSPHPGADAFIEALGDAAQPFRLSLMSTDELVRRAADEMIAAASPVVSAAAAGGILHYRRHYPDDPFLRLWSGLVLLSGGHAALAAAEFHHAQRLGLAPSRVAEYLTQSLERCQ